MLAAVGAQRVSASTSTTASSDSTEPGTTEAATTTTAPPGRPSLADQELLAFLLTAELAASTVYSQAGASGEAATLFAVLAEHHLAYANNIAGRLGKAAVNAPNASLVEEFGDDLQGADAASRGRELERMLVASHLDAVSRLDGLDAAKLLAAIVVVEGQHIAALAALEGLDPAADYEAYATETADPISPDDYPAVA